MTYQRRLLAGAGVLVTLAAAPVAARAQGLDPIVRVSVLPGRDFTQGEPMQINLSVVPPADAPGTLTALVDGLGASDGFVQWMWASEWDCPYGGCGSGVRPTPCAAGRACFQLPLQLDVRLPVGRHAFPITVVDARGRQTALSAAFDVRPATDRDGDGMPDAWEDLYGLSFDTRIGGSSDDPDGDGVANIDEFRRDTNPRSRYLRYFAEGSTGDRAPGLEQCFVIASLNREDFGGVWITAIGDSGRRVTVHRNASNANTAECPLDRRAHPADRVVAVLVEGEKPFVAERIAVTSVGPVSPIAFGTPGVAAPASRWMFADGGTDGVLDTFYLGFNPGREPVEATFTYRTAGGAIAGRRTLTLPPGTRTTTWVNVDEASLGRREAWVEVVATAPILLERAWRFNPPGRTVTQHAASPGTADASSRWFFPDVDGQALYDTTIVLANPADREAVLDVSLLFTDRDERKAGQVRVPAGGRVSVPARAILPDGRAAVEIVSANGVRVVGERTLSGRDGSGAWRQATIGEREPGTRWTLASVNQSRDVVVTNVSSFPARVELYFHTSYSYADDRVVTIDVPARRRAVVAVTDGRLGTLRATSQPTDRGTAEIVVEAERFSEVGGVAAARSSAVSGVRVQ